MSTRQLVKGDVKPVVPVPRPVLVERRVPPTADLLPLPEPGALAGPALGHDLLRMQLEREGRISPAKYRRAVTEMVSRRVVYEEEITGPEVHAPQVSAEPMASVIARRLLAAVLAIIALICGVAFLFAIVEADHVGMAAWPIVGALFGVLSWQLRVYNHDAPW